MPQETSENGRNGPQTLAEAWKEANREDKQQSMLWMVFLLLGLFSLGVWNAFLGNEENGCSMTFMFEYPLYFDFKSLGQDIEKKYPQYKLQIYAEGREYAYQINEREEFNGIPVLFIPGNAGSSKQVRSMASVALRKAMDDDVQMRFHFNYFSIDFNEEFSALYGGSLEGQAEYAAACVTAILSLYKDKSNPPTSVIIIGHSIGGMVARSLLMQPGFDVSQVNTIITLATPHEPVLLMDKETKHFYDRVDQYWNETRKSDLRDLTFVSIGGGDRDFQVRSGLTFSRYADINVATTAIPGVWVSTDHLCIAWCKQLILALNRAIFDSVDKKTYQISQKSSFRRKVFKFHLEHRLGGKRFTHPKSYPRRMNFDKDGFWVDSLKRQFVFMREHVAENSYIMIKIFDDYKHQSLTIDAINLKNTNWIFGCKSTIVHKNTRICDSGDNLSLNYTHLLPAKDDRRKSARINLRHVGEKFDYSYIIVFIPKKSEHIKVNIDVYNEKDRNFPVEVPRWITFWKRHPIVQQTHPTSVFYNVSLQSLDLPWQAYDVHVTPINQCEDTNHFGILSFITPWSKDSTQALIGKNMTNKLTAKLQMPKPLNWINWKNPEMLIHLNPSCQYKIEIQSNLSAMWGQMVRFYGPMVLPMSIAAAALAIIQQLRVVNSEQKCPSLLSVLSKRVTPISVVMPGRILSSLLTSAALSTIVLKPDLQILSDMGVDFAILPIIMFFISIGIVIVVASAAWFSILIVGTVANKIITKLVTRQFAGNERIAESVVTGVTKTPLILSGLLIALASGTCGTIALSLGTFLHILHLFYIYEDYLKTKLWSLMSQKKNDEESDNSEEKKLECANFQFSIMILWALLSLLNIPSLLAWTKLLPELVKPLNPDPSFIVAVFFATSMIFTWNDKPPKINLKFYDRLTLFLQFLCVLIVLYGSLNIYRVNLFMSVFIIAIGLHQNFGPRLTDEEMREKLAAKEQSKTEATKTENKVDQSEEIEGENDASQSGTEQE